MAGGDLRWDGKVVLGRGIEGPAGSSTMSALGSCRVLMGTGLGVPVD